MPCICFNTTQVLCLGVRDMQKFQLLPVDSPLVEVECGGATERSQHIKDTKKNPNFPQSVFRFDVVSIVYYCKVYVLWLLQKRSDQSNCSML